MHLRVSRTYLSVAAAALAALILSTAIQPPAVAAEKNHRAGISKTHLKYSAKRDRGSPSRQANRAKVQKDKQSTTRRRSIRRVDPTTGRRNQRREANRAQYHECAEFSLRVFQGCSSQAGNESQKIRTCRSHYQSNVTRCQKLL